MKELSIEEKTKVYDGNYKAYIELINRLESVKDAIKKQNYGIAMDILCKPYPEFQITTSIELAESEDERIRKELIDYHRSMAAQADDYVHEAWIAWLEKQGEQKYIPKYKIGDYVKNTNYKGEPIYEIVYMDKECYICENRGKEIMGDKAVMHFSFDNPYLRLVQKPTDKVEPKLKKE